MLFSLSEYAKQKHDHEILKIDNAREKRKRLLRLLLCFHAYRRSSLLSEEQLSSYLWLYGNVSKNDLKEINPRIAGNSSVPSNWFGNVKLYEMSNGIQVVEAKIGRDKTFYYPVLPGLSLEDLLYYMEDLLDMTDHRPFSGNIPFIPYMREDDYSESEVDNAIRYLLDAKIIKHIRPIFPREERFDIV